MLSPRRTSARPSHSLAPICSLHPFWVPNCVSSAEVQPFPCTYFSLPLVCVMVISMLSLRVGDCGSHTQSLDLGRIIWRLQARADSVLSTRAACMIDGSAQVLPGLPWEGALPSRVLGSTWFGLRVPLQSSCPGLALGHSG